MGYLKLQKLLELIRLLPVIVQLCQIFNLVVQLFLHLFWINSCNTSELLRVKQFTTLCCYLRMELLMIWMRRSDYLLIYPLFPARSLLSELETQTSLKWSNLTVMVESWEMTEADPVCATSSSSLDSMSALLVAT
jgi:hypothetical protein